MSEGHDAGLRERPCMAKLLQEGAKEKSKQLLSAAGSETLCSSSSGSSNSAVLRGMRALGWRQQFQFSKAYQLEVAGVALEVRQIEMGEVTGLGTGANVWPAAVVLAKFLEKEYGGKEEGLKGRRVADLGCGTGLTGLAAAVLGAEEVLLTDQGQILFLAHENIGRNRDALGQDRASRVKAVEYDWGGDDSALAPPLDVVLVSDCLLPKLYPIEPLAGALDKLSGPDTVVLVSYEPRYFPAYDPVEYFDKLLGERGLARERVGDDRLDQQYWADDIEVWQIRRRRWQPEAAGGGS